MVRLVPDAGGGIKSVCVVGNSVDRFCRFFRERLPCGPPAQGSARLARNLFAVPAMARL